MIEHLHNGRQYETGSPWTFILLARTLLLCRSPVAMATYVPKDLSRPSSSSSSKPFINRDQKTNEYELQAWANSLSPASTSSPLAFSSPAPHTTFTATATLQIQTLGKPCFSPPVPFRPDPIPVFDVDPINHTLPSSPRYISLRPQRSSGSSQLVSGDDHGKVLSTTTYRWGPGKPPVISLPPPNQPFSDQESWDTFPITPVSLLSRSQIFRHPQLGTFSWRYASRSERRSLDPKARSLLILERVTGVAVVGGKTEENRQMVGMFARGEET